MQEKNVFEAKAGTGIIIFLCLVLGSLSIFYVVLKVWFGLAINVIVAAFILHVFLTTRYTYCGSNLNIRCGFFFNKTISIGSIRKITETRNPISAPATSLNRLEIFYNKLDTVLVSPADKAGFIQRLLSVNGGIAIEQKAQV